MDYDIKSIDALVDEIKATTQFITGIFSNRVNYIFVVVILGALLAINLLIN
jgi:hypothetical protein